MKFFLGYWMSAVLLMITSCATSIRNDEPEWGARTNGIRVRAWILVPPQQSVPAPNIRFEIQNLDVDEAVIWHALAGANWVILGWDAEGRPLELTSNGRRLRSSFSPGGTRFQNVPIRLKKGQTYSSWPEFTLSDLFQLPKHGMLQFQVIYEEYPLEGWAGRAESNIVKVNL